jgi:hypothetical protein
MSSVSLEVGEIVNAEVRDPAGVVTTYSHDYPVDPSRLLRIPLLDPIFAEGKPLTPDLRDEISDKFVANGVFSSVTVNLNLAFGRVDFDVKIQPGDTLFLRILDASGVPDPSSGSFVVDNLGSINIPFLGGVQVSDALLFEAEHQIEQGIIDGGFLAQPFILNLTRIQLA